MTLRRPPWGEDPILEWDDDNEPHCWEHRVTSFEVDECFENDYTVMPHPKRFSEPERYGDRYILLGETNGGRKLFVVVQHVGGDVVRPITAQNR